MSKTNSSLSPIVNGALIFVWATAAVLLVFIAEPRLSVVLPVIGIVLGAVGGIMQHLSITQSKASFVAASSLLEVRRVLAKSIWGRRYIYWLYFSKVALIAAAFAVVRQPLIQVGLGYLAAYASLMFMRELVTLSDTVALRRFTASDESNAA